MAAGYSGTPQATKLGIKPGLRVCLDHPPDDWSLTDPPDGMVLVDLPEPADIIISFFRTADEFSTRLPTLARQVFAIATVHPGLVGVRSCPHRADSPGAVRR